MDNLWDVTLYFLARHKELCISYLCVSVILSNMLIFLSQR